MTHKRHWNFALCPDHNGQTIPIAYDPRDCAVCRKVEPLVTSKNADKARRELKQSGIELTLNMSDSQVLQIRQALDHIVLPERTL